LKKQNKTKQKTKERSNNRQLNELFSKKRREMNANNVDDKLNPWIRATPRAGTTTTTTRPAAPTRTAAAASTTSTTTTTATTTSTLTTATTTTITTPAIATASQNVPAGPRLTKVSTTTTLSTSDYSFYHSAGRAVLCLLCLKDGSLLSGSVDKTIIRWTKEGRIIQSYVGHTFAVVQLVEIEADSPSDPGVKDGLFASASWDDTIRLWNTTIGFCLRIVRVMNQPVYDLIQLKNIDRKALELLNSNVVMVSSNRKENKITVWKLKITNTGLPCSEDQIEDITESSAAHLATINSMSVGIAELSSDSKKVYLNNGNPYINDDTAPTHGLKGLFVNCTSNQLNIYTPDGQCVHTVALQRTGCVGLRVLPLYPSTLAILYRDTAVYYNLELAMFEQQSYLPKSAEPKAVLRNGLIACISDDRLQTAYQPKSTHFLRVCDSRGVVFECKLQKPTSATIQSVIELPDRFVAIACSDGLIHLWKLTEHKYNTTLLIHLIYLITTFLILLFFCVTERRRAW